MMAVTTLDGGHATTSRCSERAAQQENKRAAQKVATQQPTNLLLRPHFDMRRVICRAAMALPGIILCHCDGVGGGVFGRWRVVAVVGVAICRTTTAMRGMHNNHPKYGRAAKMPATEAKQQALTSRQD